MTTGLDNVVEWSSIHNRTEWEDVLGQGLPASGYYESVKKALEANGFTEDQEA